MLNFSKNKTPPISKDLQKLMNDLNLLYWIDENDEYEIMYCNACIFKKKLIPYKYFKIIEKYQGGDFKSTWLLTIEKDHLQEEYELALKMEFIILHFINFNPKTLERIK